MQMLGNSLSDFPQVFLDFGGGVLQVPNVSIYLGQCFQHLIPAYRLSAVLTLAGQHPYRRQNSHTHRANRRRHRKNDTIIYTHGTFFPPQ